MNRYLKCGLLTVVSVFSFGLTMAVMANGFYAPSAPTAQPYFNGPYVGIGAGVVNAQADVKNSANANSTNMFIVGLKQSQPPIYFFDTTQYHDFDMGKYGFNGNIFVGYGRTLNTSYYLGGELFGHCFSPTLKKVSSSTHSFYDWDTMRSVDYNVDMSAKVKNRYSFGGDIRAGYLVLPRTMVYVLFGLDYARFNVKSEFAYQTTPNSTFVFGGHIADDFKKWKLGYMPGIGIEAGLNDHVSLRAQYTHTFYSSFSHSITFEHGLLEPGAYHKESLTTKVKPSRGLFTVKLSYLFN